jgi:hypothetical protein
MQTPHYLKAGILAAILIIVTIGSWEICLHQKGLNISYDDGEGLWSDKRAKVYAPINDATIFIGSSRIKYDLDHQTWKNITGNRSVQLAIEGSTPVPALEDLANDTAFKGRLVVDVTEGLFFSASPFNRRDPDRNIKYFHDRTPAQRVSFELNRFLESQFLFLDKENYSINAYLDKQPMKDRPGVFKMPIFPLDFGRVDFERQNKMTDQFVADTNIQNTVKDIWKFFASVDKELPPSGDTLQNFLVMVKGLTDKIKARGGEIVFVRTPSSGPYWMGENAGFPREKYWDRLLTFTNCPGIHFKDYPAMANFICPEWSHLSPADAKTFTTEFIRILEEKGWKFAKTNSKLSASL